MNFLTSFVMLVSAASVFVNAKPLNHRKRSNPISTSESALDKKKRACVYPQQRIVSLTSTYCGICPSTAPNYNYGNGQCVKACPTSAPFYSTVYSKCVSNCYATSTSCKYCSLGSDSTQFNGAYKKCTSIWV